MVGGAAVAVLGSKRTTKDVDIVSVSGGIRTLRDALPANERFSVDRRTRHTYFNSTTGERVPVDIIAPPWSFKSRFDANTVILERAYGVLVLNPVALSRANASPF